MTPILIARKHLWLLLILLLSACTSGLEQPAEEFTLASGDKVAFRTNSYRADVEETASGHLQTGLSAATLDFVSEEGRAQTVGLRFYNVTLPQGAVVSSARIVFRAAASNSGSTSLTVHAEAADNAAPFSRRSRTLSERTRTSASAAWWPRSWVKGQVAQTSDLSRVIREVIGRPGWEPGNSLAFFLSGSGATRSAVAYESAPGLAPTLHVSYTVPTSPAPDISGLLFGVVQSDPRRVISDRAAGIGARTLDLGWDAYEPHEGVWNDGYLSSKRAEYQDAIAAGFKVVVDLGLQYPPAWVLVKPDSRFVNQYGTAFTSGAIGSSQVNAVFNDQMRAYQARYVRKVITALGVQPYAVRLGWGWYGEIGYPPIERGSNSYWAYDALAQGLKPGLPPGVAPSPVPGWRPSTASPVTDADRRNAKVFLEWYLDSLENYQRWQVALLRELYDGKLFVLYPSFGVRPGQLDAASSSGLSGQTAPEYNGEIQRGFDFERLVRDIRDPLVSPYTTWLDANGWFVDDRGADPTRWSPAHYLVELARTNSHRLTVWGENTGNNRTQDLYLSFARVRDFGLGGMFWAFNSDLYSGGEVSVEDYGALIKDNQRTQAAVGAF